MESADALMEEKKLMAEAKYRNYMSNIDKALRNFEFSSEWADLISALGKLSKAISSNTQYQVIPRRIKISKRLAQCMHPALPSGVHLKALETYSVIFDKTGPERLATELFIYSAGLFPLLGYAAMNVRPNLLGIYETFFVPLGEKLRPALSGFLSGVLPGYENGLDHFERTNSLLNQVCIAVNPTHFYTVLWECVATNASIRLPAITYLLEHFNKRLTMQEQIFIMGHNRDIMMSGLCACLNDSMILVQRNALEFLLLGFPMHTQYLTEADLIKLVTNGLNTILRRDMSLNRRLYSWLLGTEVAKNSPTTYEPAATDDAATTTDGGENTPKETYFSKHARRILIQSIICTLKFSLESDPVELKPYRIMVSLLDKADIGSAVLDFVLCDIIRTMTLSSGNVEVIKSANVLFATFDPAYIWSFMTSMYEKSCKMTNKPLTSSAAQARKVLNTNAREPKDAKFKCEVGSGDPDLVEICFLTEFLLETLSLEMYNETTRIYLPKVFLAITQMLTMHLEKISSEEITASLKLCMKIVSRVQPVITSPIKLPPRLNQGYVSSDERSLKREATSAGGHLVGSGSSALNSLEKSKSDSKLNQFGTTATPANSSHSYGEAKDSRMSSRIEPIRRSNSNQHIERKSPKKKAKSYSKLSELDKEICPETGQIIDTQQSSSDVDTPLSIKKLKSKAKTPYMRMRGSPKKSRPKDIRITSPSPTSPTSLPANSPELAGGQQGKLLRADDETDDLPKSAPPEGKRQMDGSPLNPGEDLDESAAEEFSILEKCIRQYEIFYEVYLSRKVLQVKPARPQSAPADISVVLQQAQKQGGEIADLNVEEIFKRDYVYEDVSPERLHEIDKLFQTLRVNVISRNTQLHSLLNRSLGGGGGGGADSTTTSDSSSEPDEFWMGGGEQTEPNTAQAQLYDEKTKANILALIDLRMSAQLRGAIKLASNLLVEMSTFPNCNKNIVLDKTEKEIPTWLKVLCLVAAYTQNDRELQLASITTLFDLISLLKSQIEHTTSPGVTFVVMLPLLKFGHVSYIEHKTRVFQLVTSILWNYLGAAGMDPAPITALLYQLHNCLESGLVERIIGNRMFAPAMHQQFSAAEALVNAQGHQPPPPPPMGGRTALRNYRHDRASEIQLICVSPLQPVERQVLAELRESEAKSFKKFELLWHLGREKQPSKGFEKTLLKVLDTLALPYYMSVRIFVTKWLQASLLRGDLMRLLKPLYKILLAPNTKRTGIVHLRHKELDESGNGGGRELADGEAALASELDHDVYAISSEYGNVVYHKEAASNKKRSPIRSFQKKIFGVTLSSKNKTSNFVSDKSPVRAVVPGGPDGHEESPIGVIVNPLENAADFDDDPSSVGEEKQDEEGGSEIELRRKTQSPENGEEIDDDEGDGDELCAPKTEREDETALEGHDYDQDFTDDSDSSIFDSESENRETSVEKDDSLTLSSTNTGFDIKRYVGDCERVTEMLSQHERTKNRKTYRLTREKTPGDSSLASITDEQASLVSLPLSGAAAAEVDDAAHPADEYFGANAPGDNVNTIVNELIVEQQQQHHQQHGEEAAVPTPKPAAAADKKKRKYRRSHSLQKHKFKAGAAKSGGGDKKRMSCISKTSTDSNNSFAGGKMAAAAPDEPVLVITDEEEVFIDSQSITVSVDTVSSTINVEDKRRNLSLETSRAAKVKIAAAEWELTPEALEKGKQNLQILRQNAAASAGGGGGAASVGGIGIGIDGSKRSSTKSSNSSGGDSRKLQLDRVEFFYNHMLVYMGAYDTRQTLYAFQTLRNIMACDTRTFLCLSITTALSSGSLKQLLIRHRKSIAGKGFGGNITNSEFSQSYRGCMHLEVLVTVCLYYARGFFHRDSTDRSNQKSTEDDVLGNCRVQLESVELLTLICTELIDITKGMGKSLACYIADLMVRCKLQKVILHCLNSSVVSFGQQQLQQQRGDSLPEQVLNFNYPQDENLHAEALQIQLLRLLMAVIKLEYEVVMLKNETAAGTAKDSDGGSISPTRLSQLADTETMVKYLPNCLISRQPMFLAAVLGALQDERLRHLHRNWTDVVTSSLNCFGSLTNIVISVVHQLCNNIDHIARLPLREQSNFPPDYVVAQLEAITTLCHYCLLDNTQQTTLSHLFNQAYPQTSVASQSSNTGQLLNSIVHSILSSATIAAQSEQQAPRNPQLMDARNAVLSHLSRIVASVAALWDTELGQVRQVKQQLMEFLSPVSLHHGANFLAAVAVTWQERGEQHKRREREKLTQLTIAEQYQRNSTLQACPEQLSLVHLVASIRVMPIDSFVHTLYDVVRSPPPIHRPPAYLTIEVSALELSYFYLKSAPVPQIGDSWCSLLLLLREGLGLTPPAQFALLMLLNEFVQRCPHLPFQDKKDIRDLHDITSRLVDSLSTVAGSCLEQTTWLRRNLAVKEDISPLTPDGTSRDGNLTGVQQYSVQAQSVLAAILANLLDVAYGSQEKDKVVTIVTTLLYNITPYLKNHTTRNVPSFYACSSLLASLSGYQYTRKAWRKDMLDLLLDSAFFQMDFSCLPFWKQIMDSLMTYDNTTFRELMSRVSLTQTGSLNIFGSREQECEQRSMLLKRLAFVIYCSEFDQYNKYMPEIQEQLANSLRLFPMVPIVQAAVFLCFRVLLLRMSPDHVTSLWPIIIAEMVQVFLAMEQDLKLDGDDVSQRSHSGMDSWSSNSSNNGLNSHTQAVHWRAVQLEAAKLLELGCVLPATNIPHFQMYRWAFVGTEFDLHGIAGPVVTNGQSDEPAATSALYVPHVRRIARLMDMKYAVHSPTSNIKRGKHLVLTCQQISSLQELYGFFSTLSVLCPNPKNYADVDKDVSSCLAEIEDVLARDFLEKMSSSTTPR